MSSIKLTNVQRRTIQRAASLIDSAQNTLDDVHSELCEKLNTGPEAQRIDAIAATHEVYRVLCIVVDTMRAVDHLAARPPRRKRKKKAR